MKPFVIFLAALLAGCSGSQEIASSWRTGETPSGHGIYLPDQKLSIDVQNDDDYLYLAADFGDRSRQIAFQGLTIWFDGEGGDHRTFGIRYPVGVKMSRGEEYQPGDPNATMPELRHAVPAELEILRPGENVHERFGLGEAQGISVTIDERDGAVRYRARIPLSDSGGHRYAIGVRPGAKLGLGIEIGGASERPREQGRMNRRAGGMGRRGGGGELQRGPGNRPEPLEVWTKVQLSAGPG